MKYSMLSRNSFKQYPLKALAPFLATVEVGITAILVVEAEIWPLMATASIPVMDLQTMVAFSPRDFIRIMRISETNIPHKICNLHTEEAVSLNTETTVTFEILLISLFLLFLGASLNHLESF